MNQVPTEPEARLHSPAVAFCGLRKVFPGFQLGPIDLTIPRGAIYGLVGPNGAGKSTLMDLLFGMGTPDAGSASAAGFDTWRDEVAMRNRVTYVSPDTSFLPWRNIDRLLAFASGLYESWDDALCARLLDAFELKRKDSIATLSFGARTKLSLVLALSPQPEVLVLDEPTTGLDPAARQILFRELLHFVSTEHRSVLISSHQLSDLERFADHLAILHDGRLLCQGSTADLLEEHLRLRYESPKALTGQEGIYPQEVRSTGSYEAILNTRLHPLASLQARGVSIVSSQALTLEELFLALTQKPKS